MKCIAVALLLLRLFLFGHRSSRKNPIPKFAPSLPLFGLTVRTFCSRSKTRYSSFVGRNQNSILRDTTSKPFASRLNLLPSLFPDYPKNRRSPFSEFG